ncbi:MAG TPA: ATP-binding protein [Polyangiaceae bacterium]|nr:ATP-binding protein [Polyangiaceae bacterium]
MPTAVPARPDPRRLFVGSAIALLALLALCAATAAGYASAVHWVDHTLSVEQELDAWANALVEIQNEARGFIATGNPVFVRDRAELLRTERAKLRALRALVADNPSQLSAVERANTDAEALLQRIEQQLRLVEAGGRTQAIERMALGEGKQLMDRYRAQVAKIAAIERRVLDQRRAIATWRARATLFGALVIAIAAYALLLVAWRREQRHEARVAELARAARFRLGALSDLAAALAPARTAVEVADVVIEHGLNAARGDTCTLYLLDEKQQALELLRARGVDAQIVEKIRRFSGSGGPGNPGAFAAFKEGRSVWVESEAEYARLYPSLAKSKVAGRRAKAFWSVPLVAEGRPLGLLGVGFYESTQFSQDERAFVDTLAHQCAQALLRASRTEAEEKTRHWFSTTLRSIGDAVIATDNEGKVTFLNPVAEGLTGWPESEAIGQPLEAVFHIISERSRAVVESPVTKVLREGKVVGLANHTVLLPKTGPEIPIDDSGAPIRNEAGEMVGVVLVFRDVTELKRHENQNAFLAQAGEALVASLDYEATLATVARFAVPRLADWCAVDLVEPGTSSIKQVAVAHVDPAKVRYAEDLGLSYPTPPDAPTGVPQVIRTGKSELYPEIPSELLEAGARDAEHLRIIRGLELKSAMVVPLRARGRTFGAMTFVYADSDRRYTIEDLGFAEDVARRASMAIENSIALKDADDARDRERWLREEAERTNRLKDDFMATVSHELRTPLNAILGWTLILRGRSIDAETDRALAIVERNARAQAKLIEDVLDLSRIVSGKLTLHLGPTSVAAAARAAMETVTPAADAKGIKVVSEILGEASSITADADRLQQVIWNLLSNAIKFTPKDGRVLLRVFRENSDVCVSVKDSGEGIRSDMLSAIFEPFQQADASTTRRHGGLGLGLAIVKQLVSAHGGSVEAHSDGPGKGAVFTVRLPVRAVAVPQSDASSSATTVAPDPLLTSAPSVDLNGLSVLIVDDELDARSLLEEILRKHGAQVAVAGSAADARSEIAIAKPDVIISDIGMPQEDGYSFIRKLRAEGARMPAIALTAYASKQDAQRAFVAGFQKHVTKPVDPARLVSVVANLGGRSL